ncbi:IclR family transcriptional regulator [Thalassobacillus sp. CUG 92003]|uniref:IclR family transcriptional regulator n=1 Tax=Thalassobacillus sp. CUG 92003 TaxID=2736641 RepID=UPI0015E78E0A|nr:IclR family transcriptional regulator [Thalassobacillus sp. CUG 92003]
MTKNSVSNNYLLSSVGNALHILKSFSTAEPEKGIRELAKELDLSKSAIHRLMATLASEGFVVKDPISQKYRLGVSILALSHIITNHLELHKEASPILEELADRTGHTVHIGVLEDVKLVYLRIVEAKRPVRIYAEIGKRIPSYCTGGGKVILAYQNEEKIERVIEEGLIPYTEKTITEANVFRSHLEKIKQQGYALSVGEFIEDDYVSVAAPIYDYTGKVFASLSLVGPSNSIGEGKLSEYTQTIKRAAMEVSEKLGYIHR